MTADVRPAGGATLPVGRDHLAAVAVERFTEAYGGAPDGVWFAPGRANLIGEHIDYVGGRVLPFALPYGTAVAVRLRDNDVVRCVSTATRFGWEGTTGAIGPGSPSGWSAYPAGVIWAMARNGTVAHVPGVDIAVHSDVPSGSGLSSSAALECALALALANLLGVPTDDQGRMALARDCITAENVVVGAATGGMDQSVALRARAGHAMLLDCTTFAAEHLPLDLVSADAQLVVINTNVPHRLVDGQYAQRRDAVERISSRLGVAALRGAVDVDGLLDRVAAEDPAAVPRMRHILTEIRRVDMVAELLRAAAPASIGRHLTASHRSLRDDYQVSCLELDSAVESALAAGALGARMIGGGFGGSALALVRAGGVDAVINRVTETARRRNLPTPQFLTAVASEPAQRIPQ